MVTSLMKEEIDEVFKITLIFKGIHAIIEILGGLLILFTPKSSILSFVINLTRQELSEDPHDIISHYLLRLASTLSISSQHFASLYLLSHGVIKIFLVAGLLRGKVRAFYAAFIIFPLFTMYELYRYTSTHSLWLLLFIALDIFIISLSIYEYKRMRTSHGNNNT